MVEYQCASMLISHIQGVVDITVRANHTIYNAAQTVLFHVYLFFCSRSMGPASVSSDSFRIFRPSKVQRPMVRIVQIVKNGWFRNGVFPFSTGSASTAAASVQ